MTDCLDSLYYILPAALAGLAVGYWRGCRSGEQARREQAREFARLHFDQLAIFMRVQRQRAASRALIRDAVADQRWRDTAPRVN